MYNLNYSVHPDKNFQVVLTTYRIVINIDDKKFDVIRTAVSLAQQL